MKIVFIDNLIFPEPGDIENLDVHPHLGLLSLVSVANNAGFDASIFDPKKQLRDGPLQYDSSLYEDAADLILADHPDAVGFTSMGCSFLFTLKTAAYLRQKKPALPILLGGPHASILHKEILKTFDQFTIVVRHEAETTIVPVLTQIDENQCDFSAIAGISWRDSRNTIVVNSGSPTVDDLDSLPMPAYDSVDLEQLDLKSIRIDAGRGCPFHCTFCSTATFFGRNYRLKSAARLVQEMDYLNAEYGFTEFKLNHDLFTVNKKKVMAFCNAVKDRGYKWGVSARVDCVDEELLGAMCSAGCDGIYFGIETGSTRLQRLVEKNLDLDLVEPCLDITENMGMQTVCSFITGYPEETSSDRDDTLDMLGKCLLRSPNLFVTQLHMLTPEPGTAMYESYGVIRPEPYKQFKGKGTHGDMPEQNLLYDGFLTDFNGELLEPDDEQIIVGNPGIFVTHFYLPTIEPRIDHTLTVDAYRILRRAGHTILSYIMRFYDGRFSQLIADIRDFAKNQTPFSPIDSELVLRFFKSRFGASHHLTSLMRYSLKTENSRKSGIALPKNKHPIDFDQSMVLHPHAYLFKNIHNCSSLMTRIQKDIRAPLPFSNTDDEPMSHYLVLARTGTEGGLENYEINTLTYSLLKSFKTAKSISQLLSAIKNIAKETEVDPKVLNELVQLGALHPATELHPTPSSL